MSKHSGSANLVYFIMTMIILLREHTFVIRFVKYNIAVNMKVKENKNTRRAALSGNAPQKITSQQLHYFRLP